MLPKIGVTGSVAATGLPGGTRRTFLNEPYIAAVQDAGGVPLVVTPSHRGPALRALYELLDGLLLTGGEDVAPERYGEKISHPSVEVVPDRDALEFTLLEWALADGLPVLAICRGIQLLNVAMGGTLYQDLPTQWSPAAPSPSPVGPGPATAGRGAVRAPDPLGEPPLSRWESRGHDQMKMDPPGPRTEPHHGVTLLEGTCLADVLGTTRIDVNSLHHQGIKRLAPGLVPVAHAPDGLIEGVEAPAGATASFLLGVQWHPEELARAGDLPSRRLFERFVAAAAKPRYR